MTRRSHRGRKGDGWAKVGAGQRPLPPVIAAESRALAVTYPDVCPRNARCAIVWYCAEAVP